MLFIVQYMKLKKKSLQERALIQRNLYEDGRPWGTRMQIRLNPDIAPLFFTAICGIF
jgi:hypothetical protein